MAERQLQEVFKEAWSQALVGINTAEQEAEKVLQRIADAAGFGVSEEEGRAYIVAAGLVTEAQAAELSPGALEIVRFAVMQGSVATEADAAVLDEAAARLQESEIDLNPRFGAWDSEALTATALDTPWIVPGG